VARRRFVAVSVRSATLGRIRDKAETRQRQGRRNTTVKDDGQVDDVREWSPDAPLGSDVLPRPFLA